MIDVTTKLFYGQKVYIALPKCACSDTVHDVSYTKLGAGFVRKYIEESDSYMVDVIYNEGSKPAVSFCICASCGTVDTVEPKQDIKEVAHNHIFVMDLPDREFTYDEDLTIKTGDIVNVYPFSDKYKVLAFNSDLNMLLVCSVTGIATNGQIDPASMKIVDMTDPATFVTHGDGLPVIPYTYKAVEG